MICMKSYSHMMTDNACKSDSIQHRPESGGEDIYHVSPLFMAVKRFFDVLASSLSLILLSPVFLLIFIRIKADDKGPVIFRQERVGYKGRTFIIYKFRSMVVDAEPEGEPVLCMEDDSRMTDTGRFLRDHHLDELPQLWNVLKGDMSFVGPRPERRYFVDRIMERNPDYRFLFRLRPGLFSEATLYNGYTDTMDKMLRRLDMDLKYLESPSLWHDIRIISATVYSILSGKKF